MRIVSVVLPVALLAACASAPKPAADTVLPTPKPEPVAKAEVTPEATKAEESPTFLPVYFAFDSSTLDDAARRVLDRYAEALRSNRNVALTIEGHADDRGTEEYNLALGERRAGTVRKYLRQSGIEENRMRTVSFGEERPAVPGTSESAWSRNRRAEFAIR